MPKKFIENTEISGIRRKYGEVLFRMSVHHMIMQGSEHFDDEFVAEAKKQIVDQEVLYAKEGRIGLMTVQFQYDIIDCAALLAKVPTWDLLYYISHFVSISI